MNILLITIYYPPVISSLSTMMQELAEELTLRGHKVTVATAKPQDDLNLSLEARQKTFDTFSIEKDVRVIRVSTPPLKNKKYFLRGLIQLMLPYFFLKQIKKFVDEKIDAVIVSSPPLPLATLGSKIRKRYRSKYILCVQDIFPQNAIDLGVMKNKLLIKFFEHVEKSAYRSSDIMTSHTQTSRKFLIEKKNVPSDKIFYISNWIDVTSYINARKTGLYRKKYGLEDKFIFLFAGVIGPSQGLDVLINAVAEAKDIPDDICILIVGEGAEKDRLMRMKAEYSLSNIVFEPFVSLEEYPKLVKDVDAGIVCLSSLNKTPVVPGKVLGYMASSVPVVALLNKESDGHMIIEEAECGYSIASDAYAEEISNLILQIYNEKDKLKQYGENGLKYISKHLAKNICIDKLIKLTQVSHP